MSLWGSNIMFLFYEVVDIPRARTFLEEVVRLPLLENRFHPPHERHGVAKYDGGSTIIALNLAMKTFDPLVEDGATVVLGSDPMTEAKLYAGLYTAGLAPPATAGDPFYDHDLHRWALRAVRRPPDEGEEPQPPRVEELRLEVADVERSLGFYHDVLGLPVVQRAGPRAQLAAANLRLVLEPHADDRPRRHDGLLTVFHAPKIESVHRELGARGVDFRGKRVRTSEIGGTVRFLDPDGHAFCLYEPSPESLAWESGPKVTSLMAGSLEQQVSETVH